MAAAPTELELLDAARAAGFSGTVPNLIVRRYGRFDDDGFKQVFAAFTLERRRARDLSQRALRFSQALIDIRDGKDNPCELVKLALHEPDGEPG